MDVALTDAIFVAGLLVAEVVQVEFEDELTDDASSTDEEPSPKHPPSEDEGIVVDVLLVQVVSISVLCNFNKMELFTFTPFLLLKLLLLLHPLQITFTQCITVSVPLSLSLSLAVCVSSHKSLTYFAPSLSHSLNVNSQRQRIT